MAVQVQSGTSELYGAILGVLQSGAAYVPVDWDDPPARAVFVCDAAGACAVVRDGLAIEQLASPCGEARDLTVDDDAWVIFTSGSTGAPKGVAVSHRCAAAFIDAEARLWNVEPDDRVLAGLSVGFDASCEEIWLAWRHGAALVPAPRAIVRAGSELGPWLAEHRVSIVSTVPTLAAMWDESALAAVRLLILGGEACPEPLAWSLAAGREVWNTYGPTEATVVSTAAQLKPGEPVSIGWPLDGWEIAVVDEHGDPVQSGEPGELVIAGAGVARYLDPVLDTERFPPVPSLGWDRAYPTGDLVRETPSGLVFIGRRDDQVKIGGRRIELGEIDAQLSGLPGVTAAVTVVRETSAGNKLLVGYVVGDVDPLELRSEMAKRVPQALVPLIVALDELPQGTSGKVDRAALPWPPPARDQSGENAGLDGTAAWLAERWGDQLGPVEIALGSDFFELGGLLLAGLQPGRYPRHCWLMQRIWFVERLAEVCHLDTLAGTPWAARYARLSGHTVGHGAQLGTLPPPTSLVSIGDGATLEPEVDLHGWWIDGQELVVGELRIGAGARVGMRSMLMPGVSVGDGAELEPGTALNVDVPSGERWAGSPARRVGIAGDGWPEPLPLSSSPKLAMKALYAAGMAAQNLLPLLAAVPGIVLLIVLGPSRWTVGSTLLTLVALAPLLALSFTVAYALLVAVAVRAVSPLIKPGWCRDGAIVGWALWFTGSVMAASRGILFPLYATVYTRSWLRLLGIHYRA
ncbi:MAG: AMP-binding protein [Solirubrobacteraceae bacterium]